MRMSGEGTWTFPKRYFIAIWTMLGGAILYLNASNLVIALVEMTSNKTVTIGNQTKVLEVEIQLNMVQKGFMLSGFGFGNALAALVGGLVYKFGGVITFGAGVASIGIMALCSPLLIRLNLIAFICARTLMGVCASLMHAAIVDIFVHWGPPGERTRLVSSIRIGAICGIAICYPVSGYVAYHWGWEAIFYQSGGAALIWYLIWIIFVGNNPATDKYISEKERSYLVTVIQDISSHKPPIPWKKMLSCKPVYALLNEFFTMAWAYTFVCFDLPLYIKDILKANTQEVGLITGIPMLCGVIMLFIAAWFADHLRQFFSISKIHKHVIFWSELVVLVSLLTAAFCGNFVICIISFSVLRMAFSVADTSYTVISLDMAGQYAGVLFSFCNSMYGIGSCLSPIVLGSIVRHNAQTEWNLYFLFLSAITMYGVIMFCIFGSGELQPWAVVEDREDVANPNAKMELQSDQGASVRVQ